MLRIWSQSGEAFFKRTHVADLRHFSAQLTAFGSFWQLLAVRFCYLTSRSFVTSRHHCVQKGIHQSVPRITRANDMERNELWITTPHLNPQPCYRNKLRGARGRKALSPWNASLPRSNSDRLFVKWCSRRKLLAGCDLAPPCFRSVQWFTLCAWQPAFQCLLVPPGGIGLHFLRKGNAIGSSMSAKWFDCTSITLLEIRTNDWTTFPVFPNRTWGELLNCLESSQV